MSRLCARLRWKSYYGADFVDDAEALALAARNEVPFSCLETCRPWGPDDEAVAPELCSEGRPCFEPSSRYPRRGQS